MSATVSTTMGSVASTPEPLSAPASSTADTTGENTPSFTDVLSQQTAAASDDVSSPAAHDESSSATSVAHDKSDAKDKPVARDKATGPAPSSTSGTQIGASLLANVAQSPTVESAVLSKTGAAQQSSSTPANHNAAQPSNRVAPSIATVVVGDSPQANEESGAVALEATSGEPATSVNAATLTASESNGTDGHLTTDEPTATPNGASAPSNAVAGIASQVNSSVDSSGTASFADANGDTNKATNVVNSLAASLITSKGATGGERTRSSSSATGDSAASRTSDPTSALRDASSHASLDTVEQSSHLDTASSRPSNSEAAVALSSSRTGAPSASASTLASTGASSTTSLSGSAFDIDGLSGAISRPLVDGNGNYSVTVALHPADLGHVQVVMSLDGNDLQVAITSQSQAGHAALTSTIDALKEQLSRGGMNVNVTLHDARSQSGGSGRDQNASPRAQSSDLDISDEPTAPVSVSSPGQIHLVL